MFEIFLQIMIVITGVTAVWLTQHEVSDIRRWAPVIGLVSQPFWFAVTITAGQYGMFLISLVYTYVWFKGFALQWTWKELKTEFVSFYYIYLRR